MELLTLYVRRDCSLCEVALGILRAARAARDFELEVVDIEGDERLEAAYFVRIPVLVHDGRVIAEGIFDADVVLAEIVNL